MHAGGGEPEGAPFAVDGAGSQSMLHGGRDGVEGAPVGEVQIGDQLSGLEAEADGAVVDEGGADGAVRQFPVGFLAGGITGDDFLHIPLVEAQVVRAQDGFGEAHIHVFVGI